MKVVLDTNILLVSISRKSAHHWVFRSLVVGYYTLCVTTDILSEYAEKIEEHMNKDIADAVLLALLEMSNVEKIEAYYKWNLLHDKDDNKFCDCVIAGGANYLVTQDKDFRILANTPFPKVSILSLSQFKAILAEQESTET
ncbi:putative toxin-antitoxin system toxin component, PIN family [Lunatimonas lonarensis]|uniref:putative toxin-antitoxin system toxin component, PIN family n=1 Tax=Lunatimonas lonarensis TaxID=1232681 RepID=UPI00055BE32A|nr:putative toxin-antitoxin system toxin component, PIN family [Lunatimonas lonarensis]